MDGASNGGGDERPSRPLVSAIIPTHNRAAYLCRALDSVRAQEGGGALFDVETIVADDASVDATPDVVRGYPEVRYIRLPEHRGVSAAANAALTVCRGRYITFLDDDDVWLPHKLRVQVPRLEAHPEVGVLYGQHLVRSPRGERLSPEAARAPSGRVFTAMLLNNFCGHHASLLIRRTALEAAGCFDETLASYEDYDLSLRLAFHALFLFMPGAVDVYNLSPTGLWLTQTVNGAAQTDAARVVEKALSLLPESPRYDRIKREARARVVLCAVWPLLLTGQVEQAVKASIATLRAHPWLIRCGCGRSTLGHVTGALARSATWTPRATYDICAQVESAVRPRTVRDRWFLRQAVAGIWGETACSLACTGSGNDRHCAHAARVAIAAMPPMFPRPAMILLRLLVRRTLGERGYAACTAAYRAVPRIRNR
jgi:hypothetical protein